MSAGVLDVRFTAGLGAFRLDVAFAAPGRGVTALFGASGSGKTTILRAMAGLLAPAAGRFAVQGEVWLDTAAGKHVAPHRRAVGYVFQEAALFPHLDVRANLRYGFARVPGGGRRVAFDEAVAWLGVEPLLDRRPDHLSGGERQRVAVARALLRSPRLLLMDEPLAALDGRSRREILPWIERLHERLEIPVVYVSHSLAEVARLADHIVWIDRGTVRAAGPAPELLGRIAAAGGAEGLDDEVGSWLDGVVEAHDERYALTQVAAPGGRLYIARLDRAPGSRVRLCILARDVSLALADAGDHSQLNVLDAEVQEILPAGPSQVLVRLRLGAKAEGTSLLARITARSADHLGLAPGSKVKARAKSAALTE